MIATSTTSSIFLDTRLTAVLVSPFPSSNLTQSSSYCSSFPGTVLRQLSSRSAKPLLPLYFCAGGEGKPEGKVPLGGGPPGPPEFSLATQPSA